MSQPIYQLWMMRYTAPYYALSPQARQDLMMKVRQTLKDAGGEGLFSFQTAWSSERWLGFGVNRFPDLDSLNMNAFGLYKLDWHNYVESQVFLGTPADDTPPYVPPDPGNPKAVYKLAVGYLSQLGYSAPKEKAPEMWAKIEEGRKKVNMKVLLNCDCFWSSEPYHWFGVEQFATLEDEQAYARFLADLDWLQYLEEFTLLGMEMPG